MDPRILRDNLQRVRERIQRAAERAGRRAEDVLLLAAAKDRSPQEVRAAIAAGVTDVGENYVQEAQGKKPCIDLAARWHFIGHLQTNKAGAALGLFDCVQTVDRPKLARALSRQAQLVGRDLPIFVEVNLAGEASKSGVAPDQLMALLEDIAPLPGLVVEGLMCIPPLTEDPEDARPYFRQLRALAQQIMDVRLPGVRMEHLSMGMSHDFEVAIEEGATIVRLGTILFGPRKQ